MRVHPSEELGISVEMLLSEFRSKIGSLANVKCIHGFYFYMTSMLLVESSLIVGTMPHI
jgi:hypothetical protein